MSEVALMEYPTDKYGSVGTLDDGRQFVHFVRDLPYPPERVWAAITDTEELARWMPGMQLEARLGGQFQIWFGESCDGPAHVTGSVSEFHPPRVLAMGSMRWEIETTALGCRLTFTDILHYDDRPKTDFANSVLAGWHAYVDSLERALQGGSGDPRVEVEVDYSQIDVPGRP